jgi:tRNA nucleotidyltransferase/poly(A) polymerase
VRFAARFGFNIEEKTRAAIRLKAPSIRQVSGERIRDELQKILLGPNVKWALQELDYLDLLPNVLPEIATARIEGRKSWDQTLRVLGLISKQSEPRSIALLWAWLLIPSARGQFHNHASGTPASEDREVWVRKLGQRLKLTNEVIEQVVYFIRETAKFRDAFLMRQATLLRWMREPYFEDLMTFHELDAIAFDGNLAGLEFVRSIYPEAKRRFDMKPLITGDDLVKLGMKPGRQFTEILRSVEDLALEGQLQSSEQALEFVLSQYVK